MAFALANKALGGKASLKVQQQRPSVATRAVSLKPLPYEPTALEPHMSAATFEYHHGKHHRAYVDTLNKLVAGKPMDSMGVEDIIMQSWNNGNPTPEFNQAAQVFNHEFFWESMKPNGGGEPSGPIMEAIKRDFGSFDEFKNQFKTAGMTQFGSGWAWLSSDKSGKLSISKTPNAVCPQVEGKTPLLTCDVWEHAYYLDYQNRRPDFIQTFIDKLINWDAVADRYAKATA